jgi:hypothetical protein
MLQTGVVSCDPAGHGGDAAYKGKLGWRSINVNKIDEKLSISIIRK